MARNTRLTSDMVRILFALFVFFSTPAVAQVPDDLVDVQLLPGWRNDDGTHVAGLHIQMSKGWKTYWRTPGGAGIPPQFNWSGSKNLSGARVHFPVPEVFDEYGLQSIGYKDQIIFPLIFQPTKDNVPIQLRGEIEIGVCEEICVPVTLQIEGSLPAVGKNHKGIAQQLASSPTRGGKIKCEIAPISDGLRFTGKISQRATKGEVVVIETSHQGVWVSNPTITRSGKRLSATVDMVPPEAQPFALARSGIRLTVLADGSAIEFAGCN